ncbi:MAG: hypothetical protein ACYTGL_30320 [Planctomycetota bacterium]|jgi:hypothetical protein
MTSPDIVFAGASMPSDFPSTPYKAVQDLCTAKREAHPDPKTTWTEYSAAWKAVAYRFRAVADHDEVFIEAVSNGDPSRYLQERELFSFFVAGLSALEAFAYGLYQLASIVRPNEFPVTNLRSITLDSTLQRFSATFPAQPVTTKLSGLISDNTFVEWKNCRNVLAHRSHPGRVITASVGNQPPTDDVWKLENVTINSATTSNRRQWLSQTLTGLLDAAKEFVEQEL